ncbi:unnamed protein product [Paramecium sonneborni]|uniref:Uncharacterized protein n=1 Tax=Paramecium sonneborni TaxID=65129 RepID=A0A8S1QBG9_9CILI|nr:unnamed protein product [Paramecium sonneborni]
MNAFGLQNNRFHQKACVKRNKRSDEKQNFLNPEKQIDNFTAKKNSYYASEVNSSYSNLINDYDNSNTISIPKSIKVDLIIRLNEKYSKKSYQ